MARAAYVDLIAEVRAQIDVSEEQAYAWLLDRSRVMNAEAAWLLKTAQIPLTEARYYALPVDSVWIEAVMLGATPYQRSTMHALDARYAGAWGSGSRYGVYAEGADPEGPLLQIHPDTTGATLNVRYVYDVPDARSSPAPFPVDFDEALVEGAIALGLARMDERFDSANYFDERFRNAVDRLKRRRHGGVGRGATAIRMVR